LTHVIQAIDRDVDGANNLAEFMENIEFLENSYGHYKLKIPKVWVKVYNEFYCSDDDEQFAL
jgi:hypothetical protein